MLGCLLPVIVAWTGEADFDARTDLDFRVMPDLHRHVEQASARYQSGNWSEAMAHSDAVLLLGQVGYSVAFAHDADEQERSRCLRALEEATEMWEQALDHQIDFVFDSDAPIRITFQLTVESRGRQVGGHVDWRRRVNAQEGGLFQGSVQADISVRTRKLDGKPMNLDHLRHVTAHEIGHVLGLGESPTIGEIMGPLDFRRPAKRILDDERDALRIVRQRALKVRKACLVSALQELDGYNQQRASR